MYFYLQVIIMIGIKTADGQFYPIFQERLEKKEIILTSAHKNQDKVKIDFFQYNENDLSEQYHLGSLQLDRIQSDSSGNSEICLNVETDGRTLKAQAQDNISGTVSAMRTDIPAPGHYDRAMDPMPAKPDKKSQDNNLHGIKAILAAIIMMILILTCFMFFTIMSRPVVINIPDTQDMPAQHAHHYYHYHDHAPGHPQNCPMQPLYPSVPAQEPESVQPEPAVPETPADTLPAAVPEPVPETSQPAAVQEETQPAVIQEAEPVSVEKPDFTQYTIRKGDTLWSLARKFYSDPYRYTDIMRDNGISSRDQISAETKILIRTR